MDFTDDGAWDRGREEATREHGPDGFRAYVEPVSDPQRADANCNMDWEEFADELATCSRTVHRIWAGTEVDNIAEQRALEKAGFTREGITRATGWRDGAWRDGVIYSPLRTDRPRDTERRT
jgi:hypothetical protein